MRSMLTVGLVALAAHQTLAQNLIVNGSFENIAIHPQASSTFFGQGWDAVPGWHAIGSVEAMGDFLHAAEGRLSIDLNGFFPGSLVQEIPTQPGVIYRLYFMFGGSNFGNTETRVLRVTAPGADEVYSFDPIAEQATINDPKWRQVSLDFIASDETSLIEFGSLNSGAYGPYIDDVVVTRADQPGCTSADLAAPYGVLNFFDVSAFLSAYNAHDLQADLAAPYGSFNFFDVSAFLSSYTTGCP